MTFGAASPCWGVGRVEDMGWSERKGKMWFRGGEGHAKRRLLEWRDKEI